MREGRARELREGRARELREERGGELREGRVGAWMSSPGGSLVREGLARQRTEKGELSDTVLLLQLV